MKFTHLCPLLFSIGLMGACTEPATTSTEPIPEQEPEEQQTEPSNPSPEQQITAPENCATPANLPQDPLTLLGESGSTPGARRHMIEMTIDVDEGILYGAGTPGLEAFDMTGNAPQFLADYRGKMEHLELISSSLLAGTSRGRTSRQSDGLQGMGLYLFDVSTPSDIGQPTYLAIDDASGLAYADPYLYLLSHDGKIRTLDISSPNSPQILQETSGFGNPWEMVVVGSRGYVADNTLGIVTVDLSNPTSPVIGSVVDADGGIQDLVTDGTHLYAAIGTQGIQIYSLANPDEPESLATLELGGPVISVSIANDFLWATNQESVVVVDVSDPATPIQYGVEDTPSWAMHVHAVGDTAYVADWRSVRMMTYARGSTAPDADASRSELYFLEGTVQQTFTLTNRGGSELNVTGLQIADARVTVTTGSLSLAPGASTEVVLTFADDGSPIDSELCLATNDPDEPLQSISVSSTSEGSSVLIGETAPNFNLESLDGEWFELAAQIGKPVVLSYFATW